MSSPTPHSPLPTPQFTAAITAGGQSRRFGSDKALHVLEGKTLLERVAQSLAFAPYRLLIAPDGKYALEGFSSVPDLRPGCGPMSGLETALERAGSEWVAFAAVDMPWLERGVWEVLLERISDARAHSHAPLQAVVPVDAKGRTQPLAALYSRSSLSVVRRFLEGEDFKMLHLLAALEVHCVAWEVFSGAGLPGRTFDNVNFPSDLE